jgi:hypothetical protein
MVQVCGERVRVAEWIATSGIVRLTCIVKNHVLNIGFHYGLKEI